MWQWYEEGKIHRTLTGHMVCSKSEVIIANILHDKNIPFEYEVPLRALDGTFYLPDFTLKLRGETWYWKH
jgi:exodeoxyribonuclease V alpha subunit